MKNISKQLYVALARILMAVILQCALLLISALAIAVKETTFPAEMQINNAGSSANLSLLGHGAFIFGVFNLIFFPMHFKNPQKVGIPFVIATVAVYVLIGLFIILRWTVPFFSETLNATDPANLGAKFAVLGAGLALYAGFTFLAARLSVKRFEKVDF